MLGLITFSLRRSWQFLGELLDLDGRYESRPIEGAWGRWTESVVWPLDDREVQANKVADQLLRDLLGASYGELRRQSYLDVPSGVFPDTVYRLRMLEPIEVYKRGQLQTKRLCVVATDYLPVADQFLMKVLWLRASEMEMLTIANATP